MKPSQVIRFGIAAVVLVLLLAACMHPSDSSSSAYGSSSGSSSGSSTSESTTSPAIEQTTGLESPQSPTGKPSLSLAPAPTGSDGTDQACPRAKWLGNPIPPGDIVTITSVKVDKPFTFDPATTATCGTPSCLNYQFSAANYEHSFCYVGVGYEPGSIDFDNGNDTSGSLELMGYLTCPSNINLAACHRDAVAMGRPGIGTVRFDVPTVDNTPTPTSPPTSSSSESTTSSPPESSSSSATSGSSSPVAPGSP
jgi:hypothetical protein